MDQWKCRPILAVAELLCLLKQELSFSAEFKALFDPIVQRIRQSQPSGQSQRLFSSASGPSRLSCAVQAVVRRRTGLILAGYTSSSKRVAKIKDLPFLPLIRLDAVRILSRPLRCEHLFEYFKVPAFAQMPGSYQLTWSKLHSNNPLPSALIEKLCYIVLVCAPKSDPYVPYSETIRRRCGSSG